jgi:hypothetical protein
MADATSVLVVDDGELEDVRDLIEDLGVAYTYLRGGQIPAAVEAPTSLFVATTRRAMLAEPWGLPHGHGPTKIAVVTEDSNTARSMLRRIGFDFLIRRPVHPYALRLLLMRAIYEGDERRRETRAAVGSEVSYRSGLRRRHATLADLSRRGCRLLSPRAVAMGSRISVQLPGELVPGGRGLWLRARVVRTAEEGEGGDRRFVLGLLFERLKPAQLQVVTAAVVARATGPMPLAGQSAALGLPSRQPAAPRPASAPVAPKPSLPEPVRARPELPVNALPQPAPPASPLPRAAPGTPEDRRKLRRAQYTGEVIHLDGEAGRVLVGRDISTRGMRVAPRADLVSGASLRLAVYGSAGDLPFMVRATVVRSDSSDGVALEFENPSAAVSQRIERLVASLPTVEPLEGGESAAIGAVVGQVLEEH